jgi:hypothetical protein
MLEEMVRTLDAALRHVRRQHVIHLQQRNEVLEQLELDILGGYRHRIALEVGP